MSDPTPRQGRRTLLCLVGLHRMDLHEKFDHMGRPLLSESRCRCGEQEWSVTFDPEFYPPVWGGLGV